MVRTSSMRFGLLTVGVALAAALAGCSSTGGDASGSPTSPSGCASAGTQTTVTAPAGYHVCLFASSTSSYSHPDSVVVDGANVFIGFQNITAKDGADHKSSTIVEYDRHGKVLKKFTVAGHQDGLRMDPTTHVLWSLSNEDGSPQLFTVDPTSGKVEEHKLPSTPHGGGFDDAVFVNGMAFIDASNPTLNAAGTNVFPALYKVTLTPGSAKLTPVLKGDAQATSLLPPVAAAPVNLVDPDSMTVDPNGDLMLDNQGGNQLLFIHNPGTPAQKVKQLPVGTQVDDTIFPSTSSGCIILADNGGAIYSICSSLFVPGTPYTATPNDSGVQAFVGTIALGSGWITPLIVGLANPHGMGFIPGVSHL